jgi:hypothetical protein
MDVVGENARSEVGKYFGNNGRYWHALADYVYSLAPEVAAHCRHWHTNDGDGLNDADSIALADVIDRELRNGRCERYAKRYASKLEMMPDEPCFICYGTGTRKPVQLGTRGEPGPGDPQNGGIKCNGCDGSGYRRPWETMHEFAVENVRKFAAFLRECGGFRIY